MPAVSSTRLTQPSTTHAAVGSAPQPASVASTAPISVSATHAQQMLTSSVASTVVSHLSSKTTQLPTVTQSASITNVFTQKTTTPSKEAVVQTNLPVSSTSQSTFVSVVLSSSTTSYVSTTG